MIWECSEGQWRGIDSIQSCLVFLLDWEIDLRGVGQSILRDPGKLVRFVTGSSFTGFLGNSSKKVIWVRALVIHPQLPPKLEHGPVQMSLTEMREEETPRVLLLA